MDIGYYELSTHLLALELSRRGFPLMWHNRSFFTTTIGGEDVGFWCTRTNLNGVVGVKATVRKDMTRSLLAARGVSISKGAVFRDVEPASEFAAELGYPVVVKPTQGKHGDGVTVGARDEREFRRAWNVALAGTMRRRILVEEMFHGTEARVLVVDGSCVAIAQRRPVNVVGDGTHNIAELIERKNQLRAQNPHLRSRLIEMNPHRHDMIRAAGFTMTSIPPAGYEVIIDHKRGCSSGADSIEITDAVHPSLKAAAVDAAEAIPALKVAGVDVIAKDFQSTATSDNYIVVEVNSMPGLGIHHFPFIGEPRDAAGAIVDYHISVYERSMRRRLWRVGNVFKRKRPLPL